MVAMLVGVAAMGGAGLAAFTLPDAYDLLVVAAALVAGVALQAASWLMGPAPAPEPPGRPVHIVAL